MTLEEVMAELERVGNATTKKTLMRHGAHEPFFGVRVGDLKTIVKRVKKDHALALELYATGNSDAMYLASLIVDDAQMTKKDLERWAKEAYWYMLSCFAVAWSAAGSRFGWELAHGWIDSKKEQIATAGWSTLTFLVGHKDDANLDLKGLQKLLDRATKTIHSQPNRVRAAINGFVIGVGSFVVPLKDAALAAAAKIGKVEVDHGDTSCQTPDAAAYIEKVYASGRGGKKRKNLRC